jgi:serine/threonine-protein kinase
VAPPSAASAPQPAAASAVPAPVAVDTSIMAISALGLADPSDPRYQNDKGLLNADLREDARRQLVEKALALYVEQGSLSKHYALVRDKLLARSGDFIQAVLEEQPPQLGKDGLMSLATRATVRVRDLQKSLNQMSREERVEFIRNNGDPKISVAITAKSAEGDPAAPAQRSPVAENLLKERIQSFGFRLWNDDMAKDGKGGADFVVTGEAKFRKLSAKLAASGITVEKFVLTSWTVKATDKKSGEEIYYNTQVPEKTSWATEDEALRDIGKLIGEEFSKGFFLSHFHFSGQKVRLKLQGLPNKDTAQLLMRELNGLRGVLSASPAGGEAFDLVLSGGLANPAELVQGAILQPLNHKLGRQCLNLGAGGGSEITVVVEAGCREPAVLSRLDTLPPAALIEAPPSRREAVVKNPETLRRISM